MPLLGNFVSNVQMLNLHACHDGRHKFKYDMEYVNNYAMRLYTLLFVFACHSLCLFSTLKLKMVTSVIYSHPL